jgi:type IV pilus assembly protein PilO
MRLTFPPGLLRRSRLKLGLILLLVLANGVFYLAVVAPGGRRQAELAAARIRIGETQQAKQSGDLENLARQFAANERDLETFSGLLLPREDFDRFLGELFEFSSRSGLFLDRIRYEPNSHASHQVLEYQLRFTVNGNYEQIRQFVHLLENSPRLIAIRTLSLTGEPSSEGRISVGMEIDTYFRMEST